MAKSKTNPLFIGSTILSNILSLVIIILTIYHHYTVQEEITELKRE